METSVVENEQTTDASQTVEAEPELKEFNIYDSKFDEAEQTIKYLYRLDKLDDILSANQKFLSEIQNTEGGGRNGSESALSNLSIRRDIGAATMTNKEKAFLIVEIMDLLDRWDKFREENKEELQAENAIKKVYT